jgi:flagellar protein FliS
MNRYFEQMILTASPVELIRLLYERAISSVREARRHLESRRIPERGKSINQAYSILAELSGSLRTDVAPELAARLQGLYSYIQRRLLEANLQQTDAPLAEALGLLSTLAEGWNAIPEAIDSAPALVKNPWAGVANAIDDAPSRLALSA